jgi:hypothetical protein
LNTAAAAALQSGLFAHQGFSMISMQNFHFVNKWGSVPAHIKRKIIQSCAARVTFSMIGSALILN